MIKLIYIMPIAMLALAGCNNATRMFDSEISAIDRQSEEPYQFAVKCKSCGALVSAEERDDAIAAWNRRVK